MTWLVALLFAGAFLAIVWVVRSSRADKSTEVQHRRTAEERLQSTHLRAERRRRLGLPPDEKRRP